MYTPDCILKASPAMCSDEPSAPMAKLSCPGLALASAISSRTLFAGTEGWATRIDGEVATQVSARDALRAQLESEHGIRDIVPGYAPFLAATGGAMAFMFGAVLPISVVMLVPPQTRGVATAVAVILALMLTATLTARLGRAKLWRTIVRSVLIGVLALLLSVTAGSFLPDPDGRAAARLPSVPAQTSAINR